MAADLTSILLGAFNGSSICPFASYKQFSANVIFKKAIAINIKEETFIPTIAMSRVFDYGRWPSLQGRTLICPLNLEGIYAAKSPGTLIRGVMASDRGLTKMGSGDDFCGYGGKGIILDKDCLPLLVTGRCYEVAESAFYPRDYVVYIDSSVFRRGDPISKKLCNSILKHFVDSRFYRIDHSQRMIKPRVVIEDISDMILSIPEPKSLDFNNELNKILRNEKESRAIFREMASSDRQEEIGDDL